MHLGSEILAPKAMTDEIYRATKLGAVATNSRYSTVVVYARSTHDKKLLNSVQRLQQQHTRDGRISNWSPPTPKSSMKPDL